jgi:S-adenosylmethionine decarboxylase
MKNTSTSKTKKIFGYHLVLDLYDCDPDAVRDMKRCYRFLDVMPDLMATHKQSRPFVIFTESVGFCGWVPIVESGVSLYTNIPLSFVSVDIYSCKKFDLDEVREFTFGTFSPRRTKERYLTRGKEYIHPTNLLKARLVSL